MTVVEGSVEHIGLEPLSGVLAARTAQFRSSGDVLLAPESVPFPIVEGQVSADLSPGPAQLTVQVGSHARERFDVVIPDEGPVILATLIDESFEWTPDQIREFTRLRDETVAAASEAASSASGASSSASDAAGSASDAAASASDAVSSASDASGSATDAAESASGASGSADAASASATAAAGSVSDASGSASDADQSASDASASAVAASTSASNADGHADRAEAAANEFGLTVSSSTGEPGSDASVTVTGDGPGYDLDFTLPQGEPGPKGDRGDDGEVSESMLEAAVATLVGQAPESLDTLEELAAALGGDPDFATKVSEALGRRAKIDGAPEEYDSLGKLVSALVAGDIGGVADWADLTGKPSEFPPSSHTHSIADVSGLQDALDDAASSGAGVEVMTRSAFDQITPDPEVVYLVTED